jgi:GNAT superfamily N-acetyltransferase
MPQVNVRPALSNDLQAILAIDHSYSTDYVWQMDVREDGPATAVTFRNVRLPRSVRVQPPREPRHLQEVWAQRVCFLVAEEAGAINGYLNLTLSPMPGVGWIADMGIAQRVRRTGIGTVLLASAVQWARSNQLGRVVLEMQSKNYPAISFAQKNGLVFCGYNDHYYPNKDVALFFCANLR